MRMKMNSLKNKSGDDRLAIAFKEPKFIKCHFCGEDVPIYSIHDCRVTRNWTASDWENIE